MFFPLDEKNEDEIIVDNAGNDDEVSQSMDDLSQSMDEVGMDKVSEIQGKE